jgi:hypothetical protein
MLLLGRFKRRSVDLNPGTSRVNYNRDMPVPILATKLYIPPPQPNRLLRPALIERLNDGLHRKLTLISAPAGFGKTTLVSLWLAGCGRSATWLSLDEGDYDPSIPVLLGWRKGEHEERA